MLTRADRIYRIIAQIQKERDDLETLHREFTVHAGGDVTDSYYLRAVASNLCDFYSGVERIFVAIGKELNGGLPTGDRWCMDLLRDMQLTIARVRPAVISEELAKVLEDFLDFRHRNRHIYGYRLEWSRMDRLVQRFPSVLKRVNTEIGAFLSVLQRMAEEVAHQIAHA